MKKLNTIYPDSAISNEQLLVYYEFLSKDFTDEQFDVAINLAVKNSFKFPPIAAFYKGAEPAPFVPDPVTREESEVIKKARERYGLD